MRVIDELKTGLTLAVSHFLFGAEDGIRTRDPHLGKVMRYRCATSALSNHSIAVTVLG